MKRKILLIGVLLIILLVLWKVKTTENFTIAERDGILCDPKTRDIENQLLPNTVVFVIQGYGYERTPIFYRDGSKIRPEQTFYDPTSLAYYFTVYAPLGLCGSEWVLETSDFVKPVVNEGRSGKAMKVILQRRRRDFNKWEIRC